MKVGRRAEDSGRRRWTVKARRRASAEKMVGGGKEGGCERKGFIHYARRERCSICAVTGALVAGVTGRKVHLAADHGAFPDPRLPLDLPVRGIFSLRSRSYNRGSDSAYWL